VIRGPRRVSRYLSEGQHSGTQPIRPVKGNDGSSFEIRLAGIQGAKKGGTSHLWDERFATKEDDARCSVLGVRGFEGSPGRWSELSKHVGVRIHKCSYLSPSWDQAMTNGAPLAPRSAENPPNAALGSYQ